MQMASACVNNIPTTSAATYTGCGWLSSRVPLSLDYEKEEYKISKSSSPEKLSDDLESSKDAGDFEFRLGDNATMLPADELFSDGKLVPLQFSSAKTTPPPPSPSPPQEKSGITISEDPYLFSPKAPRCSSRWRELLGLKKLSQQPKTTPSTTLSASASSFSSSKSSKLFLNRNSKTASSYSSSFDSSSLSLPLLKDSSSSSSSLEFESISISSSRLSLSSTSSGHDHDELPRASLDSEKPNTQHHHHHHRSLSSGPRVRTRPRMRKEPTTRGVSVDSPRMNPSGKVVFQSLERSSSSPSCFNGGPRHNNKHNNSKGVIERSYSANVHVRITPVLNVPVCSLRGSSRSGVFGFANFFSSSSSSSSSSSQSQKKEGNNNGKQ